jgi:IS30 family transposase
LSEAKMQKDIAEKICTSRSTLTRELQRNGGRENYGSLGLQVTNKYNKNKLLYNNRSH